MCIIPQAKVFAGLVATAVTFLVCFLLMVVREAIKQGWWEIPLALLLSVAVGIGVAVWR